MDLLTRDSILTIQDLKTESVEVPEWGGAVMLRELSGDERSDYVDFYDKRRVNGEVAYKVYRDGLVAASLCDASGARIFALTDEDVAALGAKNGAALERLFERAQILSGIGAKATDELEKNSESGQNGDSSSS